MEIVVSISAAIATAAIALAAWVQTHNAVRPYLYSTVDLEDAGTSRHKNKVVVKLHNGGLGPAIIKDYYVMHQNSEREHRDQDIHILMHSQFHNTNSHILRPNGAIKAGSSVTVLEINENQNNGDHNQIQARLRDEFTLIVKYKSFLWHDVSVMGVDFSRLGRVQTYNSKNHMWADNDDEKQAV